MFRPFELGLALAKDWRLDRLTDVSSDKAARDAVSFDDLQQLAGSTPNASWTRTDDSVSKSGVGLVPMLQSHRLRVARLHAPRRGPEYAADAFNFHRGHAKMAIDGIPLRDRVWFLIVATFRRKIGNSDLGGRSSRAF